MAALTPPHPVGQLAYNGKDISADIAPYLLSVTYTDYLEGESDEIEVRLENTDRRWENEWYPEKGAALTLSIGYEGGALLPCGTFEIDEIALSGTPDVVTLKALATGPMKAVRTRRAHAYENTTLAAIAKTVADRNKMTVVGEIDSTPIERATQYHERDVEFLARVAKEHGYIFKITGDKLVFHKQDAIWQAAAVRTIRRTEVKPGYELRDKISGVVEGADVHYHDHKKKELVTYGVRDGEVVVVGRGTSADRVRHVRRVANKGEAQRKAGAALEAANQFRCEGRLPLMGDPSLPAGVNVHLKGFGKLSGLYTVSSSRHTIARDSGYSTELEVKRVKP